MKKYGIYAQGARITLDDFDPTKVIPYLCESYDITLSDEMLADIKNNSLSNANYEKLCAMLQVEPEHQNLQEICNKVLNHYIIDDIFVDDAEIKVGNEMISAWQYDIIKGCFEFDNPDKPFDHINGRCMMLCFDIPYVWNIQDALIPVNKRLAVFQLQQASKMFLKDDIDWMRRLGSLTAVGKCS